MDNNWSEYHQQTKDRAPSPLLVEALAHVQNKNVALDLGAGALVESKFLLDQGFGEVVAVDIVPFEVLPDPHFTFVKSSFKEYPFPENEFDLVNANLALSFNDPESFLKVWQKVIASLKVGGIFAGQLFGPNDAWSNRTDMNFHTKEEVHKLLAGLEIIKFNEVEKELPLAAGGSKHWHIFPIIFRKIN